MELSIINLEDILDELELDLNKQFKDISKILTKTHSTISNRKELLKALDNEPGVYLFFEQDELVYVGSSGKYRNYIGYSDQGVKGRIQNAKIPYTISENSIQFDRVKKQEKYVYSKSILFENLKLRILYIDKDMVDILPVALESMLIQSYFNEKKSLPKINNAL